MSIYGSSYDKAASSFENLSKSRKEAWCYYINCAKCDFIMKKHPQADPETKKNWIFKNIHWWIIVSCIV
jgi:hypothetical protein